MNHKILKKIKIFSIVTKVNKAIGIKILIIFKIHLMIINKINYKNNNLQIFKLIKKAVVNKNHKNLHKI